MALDEVVDVGLGFGEACVELERPHLVAADDQHTIVRNSTILGIPGSGCG
jgi:hypothetical protein